ncbi:hypothetical protein CFP56_001736 [Quercus suber]|uniref:Wall-associated receptor kinase galacturonan-binding domain-containing protein n=1 Tax=Quercus suber TaxID=58331 RepID=A0AAW0ILC7_QUESU
MARGLALSAGVTAFIALVLLHETCSATAKAHPCAPSSCGDIHDISSPFRLKTDPKNCGDPRYELLCENNHTVVYLAEGRKYYVQEINYSMYRIRVVEPVIQKENYIDISTPSNSLYRLLQYYYRSGSQETDLSLELH